MKGVAPLGSLAGSQLDKGVQGDAEVGGSAGPGGGELSEFSRPHSCKDSERQKAGRSLSMAALP